MKNVYLEIVGFNYTAFARGQVWKDVDGVLTCDPRVYSNALPVPFLTFDEASELAYFGAQVLPLCI
jgi:aspartokinase